MEKDIENALNTGIYMEHGEFHIGGKLYLINPARVRSICYDDTPDEEKITIDFNHPDNKLEYYCLDCLLLDWNRIKRDFIKFWNNNSRDIEKTIANSKEYERITNGKDEFLEQKLEEIKTCRKYYLGSDQYDKNDGKPHHYTKEQYLAILKRKKENEINSYEEQKRLRKEMIEKRKEEGESSQEEYERALKRLEDKYAFLSNKEWLEMGLDISENCGGVITEET
jgi:hypothetical protein